MPYPELNLATRPFRDYRLFALLAGLLWVAALGITAYSARAVVRKLSFKESTQARIAELERDLAGAKAEAESLRSELAGVDFKGVHETALAVNDLIGRRTFAWSRILERLEQVLPDDVRLVSLSTSQERQGGVIAIRFTCITPARDGMLRAFSALHADPTFTDIVPGTFTDEEFSSASGKKFELNARFQEVQP